MDKSAAESRKSKRSKKSKKGSKKASKTPSRSASKKRNKSKTGFKAGSKKESKKRSKSKTGSKAGSRSASKKSKKTKKSKKGDDNASRVSKRSKKSKTKSKRKKSSNNESQADITMNSGNNKSSIKSPKSSKNQKNVSFHQGLKSEGDPNNYTDSVSARNREMQNRSGPISNDSRRKSLQQSGGGRYQQQPQQGKKNMKGPGTKLIVSLTNFEFVKDFNYFVNIQLDREGEKVASHHFLTSLEKNGSLFGSHQSSLQDQYLHFAYSRTWNHQPQIPDFIDNRDNPEASSQDSEDRRLKGQARLIGECELNLDPHKIRLTEISNEGIKLSLKFLRDRDGHAITVGRFAANLKLVGGDIIPGDEVNSEEENDNILDGAAFRGLNDSDIIRPLPRNDQPGFAFRMRVDIRHAVDLALNPQGKNGLPSTFLETGLVEEEGRRPEDRVMSVTKTVAVDRNPIYNQQFLLESRPDQDQFSADYLYIGMVDNTTPDHQTLEQIWFPVSSLVPFLPYNLEMKTSKYEFKTRGRLFISIVLEKIETSSFTAGDEYTNIVVHNASFEPLPPGNIKRFWIVMCLYNYKPSDIEWLPLDLENLPDLEKLFKNFSSDNKSKRLFAGSVLKVPPIEIELFYKGVSCFCLPKSLLSSQVRFYLMFRDLNREVSHKLLPNVFSGYTQIMDKTLTDLYYSETEGQASVPVDWEHSASLFPSLDKTNTRLFFGVYPLAKTTLDGRQVAADGSLLNALEGGAGGAEGGFGDGEDNVRTQKYAQLMRDNLQGLQAITDEKERWRLMSKELSQKQELAHRMLREYDEKTENLRLVGDEIANLRRESKLAENENKMLKRRLEHEEKLEIHKMVTKEIAVMGGEELRIKLVKIAQAYRDERGRNEEFERALKAANRDLLQVKRTQSEFESLQKMHLSKNKKLLKMQKELRKIQLYRETIKKQEKVIHKLERLLEATMKDSDKASKRVLELEKLKSDNLRLKNKLKEMAYGDRESEEVERYREEIRKLERIRNELVEELKSKRPTSAKREVHQDQLLQLEIQYESSKNRVESLQDELKKNSKRTGEEIAQLQANLQEKQSLVEAYNFKAYSQS